jgi:SAM-dependent methyltransferase
VNAFLELLVCPVCGGALAADWSCRSCGLRYEALDGIPNLRLPGDTPTEVVRRFYEHAPFPGYPLRDSLAWLRARAERSEFARLLDQAIPYDARINGVQFIETDLHRPGLRPGAFDVVYSSGVLHHTPDPRASFARIAQLARPGGMIVLGLYNTFARIPLRLSRLVARMSGDRLILFDPVLCDRKNEPARWKAWLRDQYQHPEEHCHTLAEVQGWFRENSVDYVRAYPSALIGEDSRELFADAADNWRPEGWLAQLGWIRALGHEGGLFVTIGRRRRL